MTQISKCIIADRQLAGLTQEQLAKRLGVSQQAVSNWEDGKSAPRGKRLQELSALFGAQSQIALLNQEIKNRTYGLTASIEPSTGPPIITSNPHASIEPITALTQAAADIAVAAKALAQSAEQIAQAVIRLTREH